MQKFRQRFNYFSVSFKEVGMNMCRYRVLPLMLVISLAVGCGSKKQPQESSLSSEVKGSPSGDQEDESAESTPKVDESQLADTAAQQGEGTFAIESSVFEHGGAIPKKYTCQGDDVSAPLSWQGVPENTKSLVLIVDDPDAPDPAAPKMTWVHWVVYNIPRDTRGLPEAVKDLPVGASAGMNGWKRLVYGGPCPPIGRHRYFHKLYALDTILEGLEKPAKEDVEMAMKDHILAKTELIGTYEKE
jgi:hypothetical protein